jgi:drug/metabolite transporter (DMT)-like permease
MGGLLVVGVLNALAVSLFGLGNQVGSTAVTATAVSTYVTVPVVLEVILLGERPSRIQLVGIVAAILGVIALGAG